MSFQKYLLQFSTIDKKFIKDYSNIFKDDYDENETLINSETLRKWLKLTDKSKYIKKIKEILRPKIDYIIQKVDTTGKHGGHKEQLYILTPNAAKHFCMISHSPVAQQVRQYFIDVEQNYRKYTQHVIASMQRKSKQLLLNQKPKVNPSKGIIYVFRALDAEGENLYKIGRTISSKTRFSSYNSGLANNLEPLIMYETDNTTEIEACVKGFMKRFQYRKYKEIYEVDLEIIRKTIEMCSNASIKITNLIGNKTKNVETGDKLFMMIPNQDNST